MSSSPPPRPLHRRARVRNRSRGWVTAGLVVAAFLLPLVPIGPYRIVPAPPGSWSSRLPGGAGSPAASVRFDVFGTLRGILPSGASGPNLSGAQVDVLARPCRGFDDCPFVASTTTASPLGNFSFTLDAGTYLLVTNRTGRFAGTDVPLDLTGGSGGAYGPVVLSAEPYLPYGNASFVLPHWNNLSRYAANCNAQLPCRSGSNPAPPYGAQQPLLSWTADGVFYVNATDDLVFDDLATGAVRAIAPWEPLYDNLMEYEGIENTEYLTVDGTYVYEFGCPAVCDSKAPVEFYAVNVSTGRIFSATLTDTVAGDFAKNGQVDLIGERGNLTLAAFAEADGVVLGLNLWNGTQWVLGRLPFFEANNLYWVPMWGSYLDVRAEGASPEDVAQVRLEGPAPGTRLATVANLSDSQRFPVNGVNGVVFNVSAQTLEFTSQNTSGSAITYQATLGPGAILTGLAPRWGHPRSTFGGWPNTSAYPNVAASEHRPTILLDGPAFAGYSDGWFENGSNFVDPATGAWYASNVSLDHLAGRNTTFRQSGPGPEAMEGLFYNTSYALLPGAYDCRTNQSRCAIQGNASPATAVGTVWWSWELGRPEFPFPDDAPLAEPAPPAPPTGLTVAPGLGTLKLRWNASATPAAEILGYEVRFGPVRGGPFSTVWFGPAASGGTIGPVTAGTEDVLEVTAWNLHGPSRPLVGSGPAPEPLGRLNLTVVPETANLTLDGTALVLEAGDASIPLEAGSYTLNATAPGYRPFTTQVNISDGGDDDVTVALVGIPPVLEGTLSPASAHLFVDATPVIVAANGSFSETLAPGEYALWAGAPGYFDLGPWNVTLAYGQVVREQVQLTRAYGWLTGTVAPRDAAVTLNGTPENLTGGHLVLRLPTQSYWLDVTAPGYAPLHVGPLNITPLNTTNFSVVLAPYPGGLRLSVDPAGATVLLDNRTLVLSGGSANSTVPAGPHEIDVSAPGFDPVREVRVIEPNATLEVRITLNRTIGWFAGQVLPKDGLLELDGQPVPVPSSGTFNRSAPVGPHVLRLSAPGFRTEAVNLTALAHATVWVNLSLAPAGASTAVRLEPSADVALSVAGTLLAVVAVLLLFHRRRTRPGPPDRPAG